jgi:hypothetical protein
MITDCMHALVIAAAALDAVGRCAVRKASSSIFYAICFTLQVRGSDRRKTPHMGGFLSDCGTEEEIKIDANETKGYCFVCIYFDFLLRTQSETNPSWGGFPTISLAGVKTAY